MLVKIGLIIGIPGAILAIFGIIKGAIVFKRWYIKFKYTALNPFLPENFLKRIKYGDGQLEIINAFIRAGMELNFVGEDGMTPLFYAIKEGQTNTASLLLKNDADPNKKSGSQISPLVAAILNDLEDIKELLIAKGANTKEAENAYLIQAADTGDVNKVENCINIGANLEAKSMEGDTALIIASKCGHASIVKLLIEEGADINAGNIEGKTPLIMAAGYGHLDIVDILFQKGVNINAKDKFGRNAIMIAQDSGFSNIMNFLSQHGAIGGAIDRNQVVRFVYEGDIRSFRQHVNRGTVLNIPMENGKTILEEAAGKNRRDFVEAMIENGADIDFKGSNGRTALLTAAQYGYADIVRLLLRNGANPNVRDKDNNTPLLLASRYGWVDIAKDLIQNGAQVDDAGTYGETPLVLASENGHTDIVETLLNAGADPNYRNILNKTPLMVSILEGFGNIEEILRRAGARKGEKEAELILAATRGDENDVRRLIGEKANLNAQGKDGNAALLIASKQGFTHIVKALLEVNGGRRVNINMKNHRGWTSLMLAADAGNKDIIDLLIQSGAEINTKRSNGATALMDACCHGHVDVVEALTSQSEININARRWDGRCALHIAVENRFIEIVDLLIEKNADVDAETKDGMTPLMMAILVRDLAIEQYLRDKGAKKGGKEGELFVAVRSNDINKVQNLIKARINVNIAMRNGITPLTLASEKSSMNIVGALVRGGANIDAIDKSKMAPLGRASYKGRRNIVDFLCKNGASVDIKGREGKTPLILACENNHPGSVAVLVENGADVNVEDNNYCTPLMIALLKKSGSLRSMLGNGAYRGREEAELINAAKSGNLKRIQYLIRNTKVNINSCCKDRMTALLHACENNNTGIIEELLNAGADIYVKSYEGKIPLTIAAENNNTAIIDILENGGANINERGKDEKTALIVAAEAGSTDAVKRLLALNSNPNAKDRDGNTALILAAGKGYLDIVSLLISKNASVNAKGSGEETALISAAKNNKPNIVNKLMDYGAKVDIRDENNSTALIYTADLGHEKTAEELINNNADINAVDRFGRTPLMNSILGKNKKIMQMLKEKGATAGGENAQFILAAAEGNLEEIKKLKDKNIKINIQVYGGDTPLILALLNKHKNVASYLIDNWPEIDVNIEGKGKITALIYAVKLGDTELVEALLKKSPGRVNTVCRIGNKSKTSSILAKEKGLIDIYELLVGYGALKSDEEVFFTKFGKHYHLKECRFWSKYSKSRELKDVLKEDKELLPCSYCISNH